MHTQDDETMLQCLERCLYTKQVLFSAEDWDQERVKHLKLFEASVIQPLRNIMDLDPKGNTKIEHKLLVPQGIKMNL